jgi:hypothetical protein
VLETGIAGGLLFGVHVSIPNCGIWPMFWPVIAGATGVWLATREPSDHRMRDGLTAAVQIAVLLAAVAFVVVSAIVLIVLHTNLFPSIRQLATAQQRSMATLAILPIAAALAGVDLIIAFVGGLLVLPVRYFQTRHAHA